MARPKNLFEAVTAGVADSFQPRRKAKKATDHAKGTVGRIEEYAKRLMRGEELFNEQDNPLAATIDEQFEACEFVCKRYRSRKRVW